MRTVSFFGPEGGGIGGGLTEADNGREAVGGFGGGKKFGEEIFSGTGGEGEATGGLVSRTGNWIRTVSPGFTVGSGGFVTGGCGNSMRTVSFFGWSGSDISVEEIDQKSLDLSLANLAAQEIRSRAPVATTPPGRPGPRTLREDRPLAAGNRVDQVRQARRSYPRLPLTVRRMNSPTGAGVAKTTRASTSGASPSLLAMCG